MVHQHYVQEEHIRLLQALMPPRQSRHQEVLTSKTTRPLIAYHVKHIVHIWCWTSALWLYPSLQSQCSSPSVLCKLNLVSSEEVSGLLKQRGWCVGRVSQPLVWSYWDLRTWRCRFNGIGKRPLQSQVKRHSPNQQLPHHDRHNHNTSSWQRQCMERCQRIAMPNYQVWPRKPKHSAPIPWQGWRCILICLRS